MDGTALNYSLMPSVYALKPAFQNLLRPVVQCFADWGITPNQVTILSGASSVLLGWHLTAGSPQWLLLPLFLPVRMALNAMDGMLAREHQMATKTGAILNEGLDLLSDAALILPFGTVPGISIAMVGFAAVAALLVEVAGFAPTGIRRYEGPFGKSDRAVALGAAGAGLGLGWPLAGWLPWLWIAGCAVTAFNRLRGLPGGGS